MNALGDAPLAAGIPGNPAHGTQAQFQQTRWTVVGRAQTSSPAPQETMASLCRSYWYPLYAFVRRRGFAPRDAMGLTQDPADIQDEIRHLMAAGTGQLEQQQQQQQ